ncbi:sensor histidine kinase [Pseudonocardia ailaonensis]|uniref:histidine kinase n=1 Tax=Pseudonocardia ailaonensis TaxID=367279 RepID=A0ABN2MPJ0_9PSEU
MGRRAGTLVGVVVGVPLAVAEALALLLVWPPGARGRVLALLGRAEAARLARWFDRDVRDGAGRARFLAARAVTGLAGGYLIATPLFVGLLLLVGGIWQALAGEANTVPVVLPGIRILTSSATLGIANGVLVVLVALGVALGVGAVERRLTYALLGPGERERLRRRIDELASTRSGMLAAIDEERRRIERDLHDGVQQRGVAVAMLLGRARHSADPAAAAGLVDQAWTEARGLLDEAREVAWRIYPTALDELGLHAALAGVAERSALPVTVHHRLSARPVSEVETALYFVVREAITNAVKHSGARDVVVVVAETPTTTTVVVSDDGRGGASPDGQGLRGLARRVSALDGTFTVVSPAGGPTEITAVLPRADRAGDS